jgi:small-conductance mechanosensitive channel
VGTAGALLHYTLLVTGFVIALKMAGFDLTALFAAGAIFAVGLAFAMQSIAQNFVAGVILLGERSIKPGDIVEVEGRIVDIQEVGIRATVARTRDGEELVIPNSVLVQTTVKNYTLRDSTFRIRVPVGVVYGSNMDVVRETLEMVAREMSEKWAVQHSQPQVFMTEFGNHSVNFEVAVWMNDPWKQRHATSDLHEAIWAAFKARGIVIAFPQIDVHLDAPVVDSIRRLAGQAA